MRGQQRDYDGKLPRYWAAALSPRDANQARTWSGGHIGDLNTVSWQKRMPSWERENAAGLGTQSCMLRAEDKDFIAAFSYYVISCQEKEDWVLPEDYDAPMVHRPVNLAGTLLLF